MPASVRPYYLNYPKLEELADQNVLDQNKTSYCDFFWEDCGENTGFDLVRKHIDKGKVMLKEMSEIFLERAAAEEMYARNLERISKMTLADSECGTLGRCWSQLKRGMEEEARSRMRLSTQLVQELEKQLLDRVEDDPSRKKELKKLDQQIQEDRRLVIKNFNKVDECRSALADRQTKADLKQASPGKDIAKAKKKVAAAGEDLKRSLESYNQSQRKWVEDMILGLLEYEKVEHERIEFAKGLFSVYLSQLRTADACQEKTYAEIESFAGKISPLEDSSDFVNRRGTGGIRPVDLKL